MITILIVNMFFGGVVILFLDEELFKWLSNPPTLFGVLLQPIIASLWPIFVVMRLLRIGRFK